MGNRPRNPLLEQRPFNKARGVTETTLLVPPPFSFPGVTARVFPLRASMDLLRAFCRSYLNVAPEICEFHPYLPYVLLVVLNYGRMAIEQANLGWIAQHEVYFGVPVGKWHPNRSRGRPSFAGWVVNTPFIFVDSAASLTTGRESYGWPKVHAALQPSLERWLVDPRHTNRLLSLDVKGFGGRNAKGARLLEIEQELGQNVALAPLDLKVIDPFDRLSRFTRTSWSTGMSLLQLLLRSPLAGFGPQDPGGRGRTLFESLSQLLGLYQQPGLDAVTLKQFPDARDPEQLCYQALVQSRLDVARYNAGGLLGLGNLLLGDITGGFRIRLHEHPSFPIVASLGLEVAREQTNGRTVSILEPFFPFWLSVDLTYGRGQTLCWRMNGSSWYVKSRPAGPPVKTALYNTFAGAAHQVWRGPFVVPRALVEVFPLRADPQKLQSFIDGYLNLPGAPFHFKAWGDVVFMSAWAGRLFSRDRSAAWIEAREVAFHVPVTWFDQQGGFIDYAFAKPFVFVDNPTLAMTQREVQGVPAMDATIDTPGISWLSGGSLLRVKVDVFSALAAGLPTERRKLLSIAKLRDSLEKEIQKKRKAQGAKPPKPQPTPSTSETPPTGGSEPSLAQVTSRILDGEAPLQLVTLKQFRDAEEPERACYQCLLLQPWRLTKSKPRPFEDKEIKIYRYPSLPLVEILGLVAAATDAPKKVRGAIADVLASESPFRIECDIVIGPQEVLFDTAGSLPWQPVLGAPQRTDPGVPGSTVPTKNARPTSGMTKGREPDANGPWPLIQDFLAGLPGFEKARDEGE